MNSSARRWSCGRRRNYRGAYVHLGVAADAEATRCGYENRAQGGVVCTKVTVGLLLEPQKNHKARGRDSTIHLAHV